LINHKKYTAFFLWQYSVSNFFPRILDIQCFLIEYLMIYGARIDH